MSTPHSHLPIGKLASDRLGRGGNAGVCPDAEVLAAYVDGGLSEVEVAVVDGHLATCAACRSLLAALSPAESGAAAAPRVVPFRPRLDWKWLSAAATLGGAAVLWFALPRPEVLPTPPRVAERAVGDAVGRSASAAAETQASPDAAPEGGTEADRVESSLRTIDAGNDDHGCLRIGIDDLAQQLDTRKARHDHVGDNECKRLRL